MSSCSKCSFNSEFEFSVVSHEKLSHPVDPRKELYHCYNAYVEKRLCPEWDYDTHLKVDYENHVRGGHDWDRKEFFYELHEDIEITEKKCDNCDFKTFSSYLWFLHEFKRKRYGEFLINDETDVPMKNETYFQCDQCPYKTCRKDVLRQHAYHRHTPDDKIRWFYCTQCRYKAKLSSSITKHIKIRHTQDDEKTYFQCEHCSYKTCWKSHLNLHIISKHMPNDKIKWFYCPHCTFKAKQFCNLSYHINMKHLPADEKNYFQCDQCEYKAYNGYRLRSHKLSKHTPDDKIMWLDCPHCSYKAKTSHRLCCHIKMKHSADDKKAIHCKQCEYKTLQGKSALKQHVICKHTPDDQIEWFKCPHCSHKAKLSQQLTAHIKRKHTVDDKKTYFHCDQCEYKTYDKSNLKRHMRKKH